MSFPGEDVEFCPARSYPQWAQAGYDQVQFADFNYVQVARYGEVKYFQPTDSEDENAAEVDGDGEFLPVTAELR